MKAELARRWPPERVAGTSMLAAHGIGDRLLTAGVAAGVLVRVRRGAYVPAELWHGAKPWERNMIAIQAHHLSTGGSSIYSHVSAARIHKCWVWDCSPLVHVTTPFNPARGSSGPDVRAYRSPLEPAELVEIPATSGRPVLATSLERTVLDCARTLEFERAVIIGDHALRMGADPVHMLEAVTSGRIQRGAHRVRNVLEALDGASESPGESRTRILMVRAGIPAPTPQVEIPTAAGLFRADFAWKREKLILEFDGKDKYFDYRPTELVLFEERQRETALRELGWEFVRVRWPQLLQPYEVERRINLALERCRQRSVCA
ncbi:hypothetical protein J1902_03920 [Arthrobacter sp. PO-11]|uniref:DUF559 domain-containing protein n=1 Tax=Arthrobacter cavernae TaxID=2817681 RepID=A0A939KLD4_9MICC|nr:hypothetical protein [Arthrobacter cavernae]